jgi:hypothetical protein
MRVKARLHDLHLAAVRCSGNLRQLQRLSVSRSSFQLVKPDF